MPLKSIQNKPYMKRKKQHTHKESFGKITYV